MVRGVLVRAFCAEHSTLFQSMVLCLLSNLRVVLGLKRSPAPIALGNMAVWHKAKCIFDHSQRTISRAKGLSARQSLKSLHEAALWDSVRQPRKANQPINPSSLESFFKALANYPRSLTKIYVTMVKREGKKERKKGQIPEVRTPPNTRKTSRNNAMRF